MPLTSSAKQGIVSAASLALYLTHRGTINSNTTPNEMMHIRDMVHQGTIWLYSFWAPIFSAVNVSLRISGVFCHQTPQAHFDFNGAAIHRELGDLLVVHDHLGPRVRRRALLIQTKMTNNWIPIQQPNVQQDYLYQHWPLLSLKGNNARGGKFKTGERNLRNNAMGGAFGLIEQRSPSLQIHHGLFPTVWKLSYPSARNPRTKDAAVVLAKMVLGRSGNGRKAWSLSSSQLHIPTDASCIASNRPSGQHWAITVQELLNLTAVRVMPTSLKSNVAPQRGRVVQFSQVGNIPGHLGTSGRPPGDGEFTEEPDGISLIHIETHGEALDAS